MDEAVQDAMELAICDVIDSYSSMDRSRTSADDAALLYSMAFQLVDGLGLFDTGPDREEWRKKFNLPPHPDQAKEELEKAVRASLEQGAWDREGEFTHGANKPNLPRWVDGAAVGKALGCMECDASFATVAEQDDHTMRTTHQTHLPE